MRILLVGGGKVGSFLARELDEVGHVVSVIEEDADRALDLSEDTKVLTFNGDGTDIELLRVADADRADWVLAVTGKDEANLVACQLALTLGASRVLARLNDPRNRPTFEALGIPVVAVTDLMAQLISHEVEVSDLHRIALVAEGRVSLIERTMRSDSPTVPLADLDLPQPALIVTIVRDREVFVPTASTVLIPGDRVLAVTALANEQALCDALDALAGTSPA
jgi:trk system potassium uptake protein TrkA